MASCPCGRVDCRENDHLLWPIDMSNEEHIIRGSE